MSNDPLAKLRELAKDLPADIAADWRRTNHFEITSVTDAGYWWWLYDSEQTPRDDTEYGQRLGLLLDIAAEVSRLKAEGVL